MIRLERVSYRYAGARGASLRDVDLEFRDGEAVALVGPSEAGKTTLCLVLAGLAPRVIRGALTGRMSIDGAEVTDRPMHELAPLVGLCLGNSGSVLSGVAETVYEEVAFGPANLGVLRDELMERVEASLARLHITHLGARDPRGLSGGESQLVAIAGLLAMRPRHLVLDEPTAQLDPRGTRMVMDALGELTAAGTSILVAEHKTDTLVAVCSRALVIDGGVIIDDGPAVDVLSGPAMHERGLEERSERRLARLLAEAGLDPDLALDMPGRNR